MAGTAPSYPPLDLAALRTAVAAGRSVRVGVLPSGQFPGGTAGRVRTVGAPETDGAEFIQVELVVGGAKDVVPFAPDDLSPLRRGQSAPEPLARPVSRPRRRAGRAPGTDRTSAPTLTVVAPVSEPVAPSLFSPPPAGPPAGPARAAEPASKPGPASKPAAAAPDTPLPTAPTPVKASKPAAAAPDTPLLTAPTAAKATKPAPRRSGDRTRRQPVSVVLSTTEPDHTGWTVQVTVGSRTVVKPTPVHPAQAWALVTSLGQPEVGQVVAGALAEHRRQAQERADRLALELAQAQADLAAYPDF